MRLGCFTIAVLTILLAMYFYTFHEGISHDSNDWGNLGSYIGGVGSLILSLSVFYYTYQVEKKAEMEKQKEKQIQLLEQIQIILSKIVQHDNLSFKANNAKNEDRGTEAFEKLCEDIKFLSIEIRTSFAISVSLAKSCKLKDVPKDDNIKISEVKEYAEKWLKWYEESNK